MAWYEHNIALFGCRHAAQDLFEPYKNERKNQNSSQIEVTSRPIPDINELTRSRYHPKRKNQTKQG
jgi:FMN-dependent NADH-azoreductase